ncbi:MAG: ImmA/IrrE family metallo-endopeptidase [Candidatus Peregrinibacteria bacterium]|nr:ImmA/IrrE family metallo-endopeptidase [Candidatus Peregrinibacteria bacterium]
MTNDTDIAEPRYGFAKSKAEEIWKNQAQKKVPVMLNDIVSAFGANVREADLEAYGVTQMDKAGFCVIMYKRGMSDERKRFTMAHEIGHIALEHITFDGSSSQFSGKSQEKEADEFAGQLLVPAKDIKTFVKNKDKTIEDIMKRYWVSRPAAIIAVQKNRLLNKLAVS